MWLCLRWVFLRYAVEPNAPPAFSLLAQALKAFLAFPHFGQAHALRFLGFLFRFETVDFRFVAGVLLGSAGKLGVQFGAGWHFSFLGGRDGGCRLWALRLCSVFRDDDRRGRGM